MPVISIKQLLESGVHFGHQTKRWNPKMEKYIYGKRNGIYIIDLQKTVKKLKEACDFVRTVSESGGYVLFVGTKSQAQEIVVEEAKRCGMFYVAYRWLGGMLTNFKTIKNSIKRLKEIEKMKEEIFDKLPKHEVAQLEKEMLKLQKVLGGIRNMDKLPSCLYLVDTKKEKTAILEAKKLEIPVIGIADTNSDPDEVDYVIPGNDDAIRSIKLVSYLISESVLEGKRGKTETTMIEEKEEGGIEEKQEGDMGEIKEGDIAEMKDGGIEEKEISVEIDDEIEKVIKKFEEEETELKKPITRKKPFKAGGEE